MTSRQRKIRVPPDFIKDARQFVENKQYIFSLLDKLAGELITKPSLDRLESVLSFTGIKNWDNFFPAILASPRKSQLWLDNLSPDDFREEVKAGVAELKSRHPFLETEVYCLFSLRNANVLNLPTKSRSTWHADGRRKSIQVEEWLMSGLATVHHLRVDLDDYYMMTRNQIERSRNILRQSIKNNLEIAGELTNNISRNTEAIRKAIDDIEKLITQARTKTAKKRSGII
jgi:hypothetical protein